MLRLPDRPQELSDIVSVPIPYDTPNRSIFYAVGSDAHETVQFKLNLNDIEVVHNFGFVVGEKQGYFTGLVPDDEGGFFGVERGSGLYTISTFIHQQETLQW